MPAKHKGYVRICADAAAYCCCCCKLPQIPTALPIARRDYPDVVFRNRKAANAAMLNEVERLNKDGRPVLIGTTNVGMSEQTAKELEERGVPCQVRLIRTYDM